MVRALRVVFYGTPAFAVPSLEQLLASPHAVCGVVTQPDRPRGRGQKVSYAPVKALAAAHGLPVFQPDRLRGAEVADAIRAWAPDLGVVAAYGKLIPDVLLELPRLGVINVHASLLPRYRGAAPVHRAIMDGATETGVTIMRVVRDLDAGPMLASTVRPIGPDETADEVERDLAILGATILRTVVDALAAGPVPEVAQDPSLATYAPRLTKEDGLLDWTASARVLHNRVRGLHPWPHAYTYLEGSRLVLLRTALSAQAAAALPGTIVATGAQGIEVAAGDGERLVIRELQLEGRRPHRAKEFLAGRPLAVGVRLTRP
jgi:methionyl-tRNA formyltransferase